MTEPAATVDLPPKTAPAAEAAPPAAEPPPAARPRKPGPWALKRFRRQRSRAEWRRLILTLGASLGFHVVLLGLCSLIVFKFDRPHFEDIFTTISSFVDPLQDAISETETILAEPLPGDFAPITPDNVAEQMSNAAAPPPLDVAQLDPTASVNGLDLPELASLKFADETAGRSKGTKALLVQQFGGNSASEAAVATGLKWITQHQLDDGGWNFNHHACTACAGKCTQPGGFGDCRIAATSLALLAYLGGGHTHQSGDFQPQVRGGLETLLRLGKQTSDGLDLRGGGPQHASFYSQGLATIALCEAYALTKDARYRTPATNAARFIFEAQDRKTGGWRYEPRTGGDTSVVGWQVMALKSAQSARLSFPKVAFTRAEQFLNSVQSQDGARYAYMDPNAPAKTTTAVGLLCRMYLGWDRQHPALQKGVAYLDNEKPALNDMYYNYYATQVLHHWGGEEWKRWNVAMRDQLVRTQHKAEDGHMAGSWDVADPHGSAGGRLYMTCLAVMTLEVYYRHLPIYQREKIKVEF